MILESPSMRIIGNTRGVWLLYYFYSLVWTSHAISRFKSKKYIYTREQYFVRLSIRINPVVRGFPKQNAKSVIGNVSRTWFFTNSYYYSDARRISRILLLLLLCYSGTENAHPQLPLARTQKAFLSTYRRLILCVRQYVIITCRCAIPKRFKNENFHQTRPPIHPKIPIRAI